MVTQPTRAVLEQTDAEAIEDPDGPMTEEQAIILRRLCERLDQPFDASLTEAQALERIEALQTMQNDKEA